MASFRIVISGNPAASVQSKITNIQTKANAAIQWAGLNTEGLAKRLCPVDTGRLRSSIHYAKTGENSCQTNTDVFYSRFVENGHLSRAGNFVAPRPFLHPAFEQAKKELLQELKGIK